MRRIRATVEADASTRDSGTFILRVQDPQDARLLLLAERVGALLVLLAVAWAIVLVPRSRLAAVVREADPWTRDLLTRLARWLTVLGSALGLALLAASVALDRWGAGA